MRKLLIILAITIISRSSFAQWKEIGAFDYYEPGHGTAGMSITCIYFLPGVPKVGFVGTVTELDKTTDGGQTWYPVWDTGGVVEGVSVSDICFKDSMNGWFSILDNAGIPGPTCFRTTDGGETWSELQVPHAYFGAQAIYYNNLTNRLILTVVDTFTSVNDNLWSGMEVSTDFGNTWNVFSNFTSQGFSFSSDSMGIGTAFSPYSTDTGIDTAGIIRTTDGGVTWSFVPISDSFDFIQPLAIPGTPICFACDDGRTVIYRSDDYGQTWRVIKDFGPFQDSLFNTIAPFACGYICGDLSRLYIQTDTGMFVSTDSGFTWQFDGGPVYESNFSNDRFYATHGYTFAAATISNGTLVGNGLWEEEWPQAGVTEAEPSLDSFQVMGPYSNPSEPLANDVSILVHYCGTSSTISAQVYNMMGIPIGIPSTYISDGQIWDRVPINAPPVSGTYYIVAAVDGHSVTMGYVVF
jgi:photosystem II stability/assembly factor-like uncharacterized protein